MMYFANSQLAFLNWAVANAFAILLVALCSVVIAAAQGSADSCEVVALKLDMVRNDFLAAPAEQKLILISRSGDGERPSLVGRRRLYAVRKYLLIQGLADSRIITAIGDPVAGNGRVEIYALGGLAEVITARKRADIPMGFCDNDKEDRKTYQLK